MSFKKIFFVFLFLGLIPISCKPEFPYYSLDSFTITSFTDQLERKIITSTDSIEGDSVFMRLNCQISYHKRMANLDLGFNSELLAMKKAQNGDYGLSNKISSIVITSDQEFQGRPAGSNLNDFVKWNAFNGFKELGELYGEMNSNSHTSYPSNETFFSLCILYESNNRLKHTFQIDIIFEKGESLSAISNLTWK